MIGVPDFLLMHGSYDRMLLDTVVNKKKNRVPGKLVGCAKCGRMGVTLYGGAVKLCRECKKREGRQGSSDKG